MDRATSRPVNALLSWHINAVRISLPEDCWLGINGMPIGETVDQFRQAVKGWVDLLHASGIYTEVFLMYAAPGSKPSTHQAQMPDQDHSPSFWTSVAIYLKDEPDTFFGMYGEPHPPYLGESFWTCWLKGGSYCPSVVYDSDGSNAPYTAAGMQELIDVIRATGASQPVSVSGVNWAADLSAWLANKPSDSQLIAEYHQYPGDEPCFESGEVQVANNSTCWNRTFAPITRQVPLWNREAGDYAHSDASSWTCLPPWLSSLEAHGGSSSVFKWLPSTDSSDPARTVADRGLRPHP